MVGAVLARDGRVIAEGYHRRFGTPHAEIDALQQCRKLGGGVPGGCQLFVTLEPCSHHGKTPPCADALIAARIQRVVVAMPDPNPLVSGRGIDTLRRSGVCVDLGLCEQDARRLNEPYVKRMTTGYPWIIAKWAQTVDGRVATRSGDSKWISGRCSRRWVHHLRARVDAVVVGIGTVLADDPRLTARGVATRRIARRVVIDPRLRLPPDARLLGDRDQDQARGVTIAVHRKLYEARPPRMAMLESLGVEFLGLPTDGRDRMTLAPLFQHLAQAHAATNIVVEGGPKLLSALWQEKMIDQLLVFVAPKLMSDAQALGAVGGFQQPSDTIDDVSRLSLRGVKRIAEDVLLDYRRA